MNAAGDRAAAVGAGVEGAELHDAGHHLPQQALVVVGGGAGVRPMLVERLLVVQRDAELLHDRLDVAVSGPADPVDPPRLHVTVAVPVQAHALAQQWIVRRTTEGELGRIDGRPPQHAGVDLGLGPVLEPDLLTVAVDPGARVLVLGVGGDPEQLVGGDGGSRGVGRLAHDAPRLAVDEQPAQGPLDVGLGDPVVGVLVAHQVVEVRSGLLALAGHGGLLCGGQRREALRLGAGEPLGDRLEVVHEGRVVPEGVVGARVVVVEGHRARVRHRLADREPVAGVVPQSPALEGRARLGEKVGAALNADAVAPVALAPLGRLGVVQVLAFEPRSQLAQRRLQPAVEGLRAGRGRIGRRDGRRRAGILRRRDKDPQARVRTSILDLLEPRQPDATAGVQGAVAEPLDALAAEAVALGRRQERSPLLVAVHLRLSSLLVVVSWAITRWTNAAWRPTRRSAVTASAMRPSRSMK